ncbi:4Fe-4S binding protein [bacterium]|nr:4Fe-4S binding protein [bacterium]
MSKARRKIIKINEEKCNGCGLCIPNCPEGALQIIDGKARLVSDLFCDGLGACIGECPEGAISIEEREAEEYDERRVMRNIVDQGRNVILAHLKHLRDHGEHKLMMEALDYLRENNIDFDVLEFLSSEQEGSGRMCGCQGSKLMDLGEKERCEAEPEVLPKAVSRLGHWPVQIKLVPPYAPFLQNADLLIAADCAPFAYASFHEDFLRDKVLLVGCPKLDDADYYEEKIKQILELNDIRSITIVHMEVPCCFGLISLVRNALKEAGKNIQLSIINISIDGKIKKKTEGDLNENN